MDDPSPITNGPRTQIQQHLHINVSRKALWSQWTFSKWRHRGRGKWWWCWPCLSWWRCSFPVWELGPVKSMAELSVMFVGTLLLALKTISWKVIPLFFWLYLFSLFFVISFLFSQILWVVLFILTVILHGSVLVSIFSQYSFFLFLMISFSFTQICELDLWWSFCFKSSWATVEIIKIVLFLFFKWGLFLSSPLFFYD